MKTNDHKDSSLFMASGCLTAGALEQMASGGLSDELSFTAENHLRSCAFCRDSYEGILLWLRGDGTQEDTILNTTNEKRIKLSSSSPTGKSHDYETRISKINERLKNRIQAHHQTASVTKTRKISNPYRWVALAASIILFAGIFYLVKFRPTFNESSLAITKEEKKDGLMPSSPNAVRDTFSEINKEQHADVPKKPAQEASGSRNTGSIAKADHESEIIISDEPDVANQEVTESMSATVGGIPSVPEQNDFAREEVFVPSVKDTQTEEAVFIEGIRVRKGGVKKSLSREADIKTYEEGEVFMVVEEMPQFPGGDGALKKFLTENIVYPDSAKLQSIEGNVHIRFVVLPTGEISNAMVIRRIGGGCDGEALRVINLMPKWNPGKQKGKPVKTQMTIPIEFKLK